MDAAGLPGEMSIEALGTVIRIDGAALTDSAWTAVQRLWHDAEVASDAARLPAATVTAHGTVPPETMLTGLSTDVTLAAIEARAGQLLMLHAAGLALPDGRVVALVGPSGRGKTTAARVLGAEYGYVTDETVAIDARGAVLPYRKPLSLIEPDRSVKVQRSPAELGLRPLPDAPLRLAGLILLERTRDEIAPNLTRVSLDEGLAGLAEQASYLGRMTAPLHVIAAQIEGVGGVHRLVYSDARTLTPYIQRLGGREPDEPRRVGAAMAPVAYPASDRPTEDDVPRWCRATGLDELELEDGRLALLAQVGLLSTRVAILDGIGPTLWRATAQPASLATLVRATIAVHGRPPGADAEKLVATSLADLEAERLLARV
jgi:hypothetical protein